MKYVFKVVILILSISFIPKYNFYSKSSDAILFFIFVILCPIYVISTWSSEVSNSAPYAKLNTKKITSQSARGPTPSTDQPAKQKVRSQRALVWKFERWNETLEKWVFKT